MNIAITVDNKLVSLILEDFRNHPRTKGAHCFKLLLGLAEEIYIRSTKVIFGMIKKIITENPTPYEQKGDSVYFKRRSPESSLIKEDIKSIDKLFNFIRMLDAEGYPAAYIQTNKFKIMFKNVKKSKKFLIANALIKKNEK